MPFSQRITDVDFQDSAYILDWSALLTIGGSLVGFGATVEESAIKASQRRRLTPYGRVAFRCALGLTNHGDSAGLVFCSQHGDTNLTLDLLQTQLTGALLSPTGFSLSVHNAVAGLLDIGRGSHTGHVAISAGSQTLSAGMTEALLRLHDQPGTAQILLHVDTPLAGAYPPDAQPPAVCGFALRLAATHASGSLGKVTRGNIPDGAPDSEVASHELVAMLTTYLDARTGPPGFGWTAQGSTWEISTY
ncbi:beta-ketoacyl synthase chain length factor [Emcibacter sp. SYSU 3D8]|uniref:beta-ketoacyl synthase chain length factor n=1 Tax=Emcibacter sp. SYSU 3D8 TaxID=3133969 RepID=UPI0031FE8233